MARRAVRVSDQALPGRWREDSNHYFIAGIIATGSSALQYRYPKVAVALAKVISFEQLDKKPEALKKKRADEIIDGAPHETLRPASAITVRTQPRARQYHMAAQHQCLAFLVPTHSHPPNGRVGRASGRGGKS